jgi:two-component system NtrC family sensor kinase
MRGRHHRTGYSSLARLKSRLGGIVQKTWWFHGLTIKLMATLVAAMVLTTGGLGLYTTYRHRAGLQEAVYQSADRIADLVRRSARSSMLQNNTQQLHEIMDTIATEPGMVRLRIFNREGRIIYSTEKAERGTMVNKQAEACVACHAQGKPLVKPEKSDRIRIFREQDGARTVGIIQPIENEAACYNAPCHAHGASDKILGVLDVNMSLEKVDRAMTTFVSKTFTGVALSVLLAAVLAVLFTFLLVHKPFRLLLEGTQKVAAGNLDHVIRVSSHDEMGILAAAFNDMTRRLKEAMQVIQHWNETLQKKVSSKTEELQRAQSHLLRMERMATLGRLAAIIAHEINNPLAGIRTYAKLLRKRLAKQNNTLGEEDVRYLALMESEAARCGDIVNDLLKFSRKQPLRLERHDASHLVEESLRLVQHRLDLQNIDVRKQLDPDLPELSCNGQQIVQALIAIMINACEAMPQEGVLEVSTSLAPGKAGILFKITDTGTGMDADTIEHIFEPFFSTKEETYGVGLGLAVVYGIVKRHGGEIDVYSEPRRGTIFTLYFPLKPIVSPPEEQPAVPYPERPPEGPP